MISLRHKLSLGFGVLLGTVIVVGVQSIRVMDELGKSVGVVLQENYRSVVACQDMKESLERLDSSAQLSMLGDRAKGLEMASANFKKFEQALSVELENITLPGEGEKAERARGFYGRYKKELPKIFEPAFPQAAKKEHYFQTLLPLFNETKEMTQQILEMNQQNMVDANNAAIEKGAKARRRMLILIFSVALLSLGIVWIVRTWILRPIQSFTNSAREIERGNLDLTVPVLSKDEIGGLAEAFNSMAARLREYRRSDRAKLARVQHATQLAIDSFPDPVAVISPDGTVDMANPSAARILGLAPGKTVQDANADWLPKIIAESRQGRTVHPETYEKAVQAFEHGQEKFFMPQATPIWDDEHQQIVGVILALSDVTGLRKTDEAKSNLLSTVSHELKTPLTSIRMAVHLLLEEKIGPLLPEQSDLLVDARDDLDRLHKIIEGILDIARIESGRVEMKLQKMSPFQIAQASAAPLEAAFRDKHIDFELDVPPELPEVWADPSRINLVLTNLLSNALKFTAAGGEVRVSAAEDDRMVAFTVRDNGAGIPQAYRGRIFEKFFRVPGQKAESGAGLGLAIAKEVVEAHGGTIGCESREGKGSAFSFTLKRADQADPADKSGSAAVKNG